MSFPVGLELAFVILTSKALPVTVLYVRTTVMVMVFVIQNNNLLIMQGLLIVFLGTQRNKSAAFVILGIEGRIAL
jgi:hypothetical protein